MLNIHSSYLRGLRFKFRPWLGASVVFLRPSRQCLKLGHCGFLPRPFQFIIHLTHLHSTLHSLSHWKSDYINHKQTTPKILHQSAWKLIKMSWYLFVKLINYYQNIATKETSTVEATLQPFNVGRCAFCVKLKKMQSLWEPFLCVL
jgi:hypothetical protein